MTTNDDVLPSREDIAERLEAQRKRIWHVQGVCELASNAGEHFQSSPDEDGEFANSVWTALEGVSELLNSIAGALEPDVLLKSGKEERA